ncbi:glycosyltransferase family 2 protein [Geomesophilobacter sediminis]|uniref:Glycosyltransferase family 2 protein n=1 Tax=Geomesophilobacter sediminis TaxID=2798584 RepID=A0A8J7JLA8_9BACT|nr:glycosyltransferase family 2 protein [Geomesophilobacter sediminis]MBJ6725145.1 glycosyltransferase family 2 protein [Geomesophilobacter sediminis]
MSAAGTDIALVIPARNEELTLPGVLQGLPSVFSRVVVVDNGSTDGTAAVARTCGAEVVHEPAAGYGRACLAGLAALRSDPPDLVAFVDADGSDDLACLPLLIAPVVKGEQDLVLGARVPAVRQALSLQQRFGHLLATGLIRFIWKHRFADLGPMRVIRWTALERLSMADQNFGWTVEMQVRAVKRRLRIAEIPVPYYPRRAGKSKISRTVSGTVRAGTIILSVIARELLRDLREPAAVEPALAPGVAPAD